MTKRSPRITVVEIDDERSETATRAFRLIEATFEPRDRQPIASMQSEVEEQRRGLTTTQDYHVLAALDAGGGVVGTVVGMYLTGVNSGFITYLAVEPAMRRSGTGQKLRRAIVGRIRDDAVRAGEGDLAWVLGEVRLTSPWLRRLVRRRGAIPFDMTYYHPGVEPPDRPSHALYRQPLADERVELPSVQVARILYAVYRRGYRVRYPLMHAGFRAMLDDLADRPIIGLHARFAGLVEKEGGAP